MNERLSKRSVGEEFRKIVETSYDRPRQGNSKQALGKIAVKEIVPFGIGLALPLTKEHDMRARRQASMITITTYDSGNNPRDR